MQGDSRVIEHLVRTGGNINAIDAEESPLLHIATRLGHVDSVKTLLSLGANSKVRDKSGFSFLDIASQNNIKPVVELGATAFKVSRNPPVYSLGSNDCFFLHSFFFSFFTYLIAGENAMFPFCALDCLGRKGIIIKLKW